MRAERAAGGMRTHHVHGRRVVRVWTKVQDMHHDSPSDELGGEEKEDVLRRWGIEI